MCAVHTEGPKQRAKKNTLVSTKVELNPSRKCARVRRLTIVAWVGSCSFLAEEEAGNQRAIEAKPSASRNFQH